MSWPSPFDPFYLANPEEADARRTFYGVNYVPNLWYDGVSNPGAVVDNYETALLQRMEESSPLELSVEIENSYAAITANAVDELGGDFRLLTVLIENRAELGGKEYNEVMRSFVGGTRGTTLALNQGESYSTLLDFDVAPEWNADNLALVVFAQLVQGKEVLQCASTAIAFDTPKLQLGEVSVDDSAAGDNDQRLEGGESAEIVLSLTNLEPWADAAGVQITLSTEDPSLTVTDGSGSIAAIGAGESGSNTSDPFAVAVAAGTEPHWALLHFVISANEGAFEREAEARILLGHPRVLLLDDDGGAESEDAYQAALDSLGVVYEQWDVAASGLPSGDFYDRAQEVIWFTGEVAGGGFDTADLALLQAAFDAGKGLYLSGQENGQGLSQMPLLSEVFGAECGGQGGSQVAEGEAGDPIGDGLALLLEHNPMTCETLVAVDGGVEMLHYLPGMQGAGVHNEVAGGKRAVLTAFDFSVVNETQRAGFMAPILEWLAQPTGVADGDGSGAGAPVAPATEFALWNAPNPFNPMTTISYALPVAGRVRLAVYSLRGELVATLVDAQQAPGRYSVSWFGRSQSGTAVASGVYLLNLEENGIRRGSRKIVLLK